MNKKNQLIVDCKIIKKNYSKIKTLTNAQISAVVKADSYGLGATEISLALEEEGCSNFFVANIDEAINLRKNIKNSKIYVLNGNDLESNKVFLELNLIPVISYYEQLLLWSEFCKSINRKLRSAIHFDTGINRYGIISNDLESVINNNILDNMQIDLIISHLASSEEIENEYNKFQLNNFKKILLHFKNIKASFSNSAGIFLGKEYHFDILRPGAALYGLKLNDKMNMFENPVQLFSPIIQIKNLKKGEKVGYNLTYEAQKNIKVATLPLGYADGILRSISNNGVVFVDKFPTNIIGRVSMDFINIDVSMVPENLLYIGKYVEIFGKMQTPDDIAKYAGTIGYEILTSLGKRYERKYIL